MQATRDKLRRFVVENFLFGQEDFSFTDDDSLMEKGIIDSTGVLELVAFVQDKFGVEVGDHEMMPENLDSITNLMRFLSAKLPPAC